MTEIDWWVGLDWASQAHRACLLDGEGGVIDERDVSHGGAGLTELCDWLVERTGSPAGRIAVAIETPRGPVVEALLERQRNQIRMLKITALQPPPTTASAA